ALTDEDVAGEHRFAAELLHAKAAASRVAPVARGAARFLVSHSSLLRFWGALLGAVFRLRRGLLGRSLLRRLGFGLSRSLGGRFRSGLRGGLRLGRLGLGGRSREQLGGQAAGAGVKLGLGGQVHRAVPLGRLAVAFDADDAQHAFPLAVAAGAAIALAADLLEDLDLLALAGFDQGGRDGGAGDGRGADGDRVAFTQHQHFAKRDVRARLAVELFDHEQIARLNPVLFAAGLDHRVHRSRLLNLRKKECARRAGPRARGADLYSRRRQSQRKARPVRDVSEGVNCFGWRSQPWIRIRPSRDLRIMAGPSAADGAPSEGRRKGATDDAIRKHGRSRQTRNLHGQDGRGYGRG